MSVFVRREVRSLAADDPTLPAYARAVATMRGRDADDPTSWSYQAGMHGRAPDLPQEPLFNGCQHGSWFFVCWHRMYLYFFERIVRAAVVANEGPEDWALPYWNYGLNGVFASLPDAFRQPATDDNPLFVAQRLQAMNQGGIMPPSVTSATDALAAPRFVGATQFGGGQAGPGFFLTVPGLLERQPHNAVHGVVGGGNGWMNDPTTAAQDPIFWLHHANVDRLWSVWSAEHANPTDPTDPTDPNWLNEKFDFFDADGQQVTMTAADVLDTVAQLDYTYDPAPAPKRPLLESITPTMTPAPSDADHEPDLIGRTTEPIQLTGAPTRVEVPVDAQARRAVLESLPVDQPTRTILNLDNIEAKANPGTVYGVYVNLPDEAPVDLEPVHQAGTLSFFGIERVESPTGDEHAHSLRYSYDITDLVAALERRGQWDESKMYVTLRPLSVLPPAGAVGEEALVTPQRTAAGDPPVTIGQISIGHL